MGVINMLFELNQKIKGSFVFKGKPVIEIKDLDEVKKIADEHKFFRLDIKKGVCEVYD